MNFTSEQKAYIMRVGLDAADETELELVKKFPDIEGWDGVFKDIDACGEDKGYPPGTDGAIAWESMHPGKKVVDWMGRDENAPEYKPAMDAGDGSGEADVVAKFMSDLKALNDDVRRAGITDVDAYFPTSENSDLPDSAWPRLSSMGFDARYRKLVDDADAKLGGPASLSIAVSKR